MGHHHRPPLRDPLGSEGGEVVVVDTIVNVRCDTDKFIASARQANDSLRKLNEVMAYLRTQWLPTVGGNWPDRFVLLNRYLRTGVEPEYFSDERWSA